jgi:glycosyltransferase involved in cell wall biosynthesis
METASGMPLLSICLPTYNAGPFIEVVLAALLPQAREFATTVEVIVVDDSSPQGVPDSVESAAARGELRYIKNSTNVGMANNIASSICTHARGEFVWVLSQHNLLLPGALKLLVETISSNTQYDAFHLNFRCAAYPDQWPTDAYAGYDGPFSYLSNTDTHSRGLQRWEEAIDPRTGSGTQTYSHIARRPLVAKALSRQSLGREYSTALDTYTQAAAVATEMFGKPGFYVGEPCLTIFNGAQTWGSLESRARVYLGGYPDLVDLYRRLGWRSDRFDEAHRWGNRIAESLMTQLLRERTPGGRTLIRGYVRRYWRNDGVLGAAWAAYAAAECSPASRSIGRLTKAVRSARNYLFQNSRPARWARAQRK